jgi:Family of unknown function (DUF6064)
VRGRLPIAASRTTPSTAGLALFLYALVLHPLMAMLAGRPIEAAEVFAIAPDPTAIATLGLVLMVRGGPATWLLIAVPSGWCLVSWATLYVMGALEAWVPLAAAGIALAARLAIAAGSGSATGRQPCAPKGSMTRFYWPGLRPPPERL